MPIITVNGADIAYDEAGSGPAVVLVHAALVDRRMWDRQFEVLACDHRVIRYDWRGYGGSGDAVGEVAHHEDLLALMDALNVERAALVGCSMGGANSLDVALAAPERVTHLALIASWVHGHPFPQRMLDEFQRFPRDPDDPAVMAMNNVRVMVVGPEREPSALAPEVLDKSLEMATEVFRRLFAGGQSAAERHVVPAAVGRLGEIGVPTLVVNGLADVDGVQEVADMLTDGIEGARRLDLPDTGHLPPLERPEVVTAALQEFLRR